MICTCISLLIAKNKVWVTSLVVRRLCSNTCIFQFAVWERFWWLQWWYLNFGISKWNRARGQMTFTSGCIYSDICFMQHASLGLVLRIGHLESHFSISERFGNGDEYTTANADVYLFRIFLSDGRQFRGWSEQRHHNLLESVEANGRLIQRKKISWQLSWWGKIKGTPWTKSAIKFFQVSYEHDSQCILILIDERYWRILNEIYRTFLIDGQFGGVLKNMGIFHVTFR